MKRKILSLALSTALVLGTQTPVWAATETCADEEIQYIDKIKEQGIDASGIDSLFENKKVLFD